MKFQKRHVKMDENDLSRAQSYEKLDLDTAGRKNVNSGLDAMIPRLHSRSQIFVLDLRQNW
jgi:hypothetical protein